MHPAPSPRHKAVTGPLLVVALLALTTPAPLAAAETTRRPVTTQTAKSTERGIASWYGGNHVGKPTASGEIHAAGLRTAAHRWLPFGTRLKVTNLHNGKTAIVRINDRGPFVAGRTIDLSESAARDLAMMREGTAPVLIERIASR